jgi:protein disulfide-isomerase A6
MYFPKGSKTPIKYTDYPWELNLVNYINEKSGTHRDVNGLLNDQVSGKGISIGRLLTLFKAGRIATLDTFARNLFTALPDVRATMYTEAKNAAEAVGTAGSYYLRVMQKLIDGPEDYIEKEVRRYVWTS